jgi:hypothetical protein
MNAIEGHGVGYVESEGEPGCNGVCGACVLGPWLIDPDNSDYQYAAFDCPLTCWPYSWSAVIDLPQNTSGAGSATAGAGVGLSKTVPALAGGLANVTSVGLINRISGGASDIIVGTPYCQVHAINEDFLGNDDSAYAVDGTIGVPGPYTVLVEVVSVPGDLGPQLSYRFNGVEMAQTSDSLFLGGDSSFRSAYTAIGDFGFGDPLGQVSQIVVTGCPGLVLEDTVSTLDIDEPQQDPAGAYVP